MLDVFDLRVTQQDIYYIFSDFIKIQKDTIQPI